MVELTPATTRRPAARRTKPSTATTNRGRTAHPSGPLGRDDVIDLQQSAGNRAVTQLVVYRDTGTQAAGKTADATPDTPPDIGWIESLDPHIKTQIDMFSEEHLQAQKAELARQKLLDARTANRTTFMYAMRNYLGSDTKVQEHYEAIKPMDNDRANPLWAHVSTRERLLNVQNELKQQDSPMPNTDVALGLRGDHLHPQGKSAGWFTHATGFAIDWKAYATPHIMSGALIKLFGTVTGGTPHMDFGMSIKGRLDLIEKMGQGTATQAESQAFLARVESEYNRLKANSDKFKTDLPETSLAPLREVEDARNDIAKAQANLVRLVRSGKGTKDSIQAAKDAIQAAKSAFADKKSAATSHLKEIFAPWITKLDAKIAEIDRAAAAKGVDLDKLTGSYGFGELNKKLAGLQYKAGPLQRQATSLAAQVLAVQQEINTVAARIAAAKAWLADPKTTAPSNLDADLDAVGTKLTEATASLAPLKTALALLVPKAATEPKPTPAPKATQTGEAQVAALGAQVDKVPGKITAIGTKLAPITGPLTDLVNQITAATADISARKEYRKEKITELGGGTDKASQQKGEAEVTALLTQKVELLSLKEAKNGLETNANDFVFKGPDVRDPGITQLLGMMAGTRGGGFFTPDAETGGADKAKAGKWSDTEGFNLAFAKAMLSNGFEWGVAWQGMSDTMHFELVEGRRLLESGGTDALVAGRHLAEQEKGAAAGGSAP
jgi:peptidoglycan hydrolase CwlO-like protein